MDTNHHTYARKMTLLALGSLLAAAGTAMALPLAIDQRIDTPVGSVDAVASESGTQSCIDVYTPSLPAVPSLPALPIPVAVPAAPTVYGGVDTCAQAGLDGVAFDANADAMGLKTGSGAHLDTSEQHETVKQTAGGAKGFIESLADRILALF